MKIKDGTFPRFRACALPCVLLALLALHGGQPENELEPDRSPPPAPLRRTAQLFSILRSLPMTIA
jgi:hypothetical protein